MRVIISFSLITVFLLSSTRTRANDVQSNTSTSNCKPYPSSGIPGIPGTNGVPGIPGTPGRDGFKGNKGTVGIRGLQGTIGIPGKIGHRGFQGPKGKSGRMGTKGSTGTPGNIGLRGPKGSQGTSGTGRKGEKGDAASMDPKQRANWKQCAWQAATGTDSGKIKECSFNKMYHNTALRVSYQGTIRVHSDVACSRWYFKFNGNECSVPLPIDSILFTDWYKAGVPNILRHHSIEGYCEYLPSGTVSVELWVGRCSGEPLGDAFTGWKSVSRIMIEEVPPSQ